MGKYKLNNQAIEASRKELLKENNFFLTKSH
jgi:hypothetical protein